jgi:glycosyltransferase involved in cell wall biosynthesis
MLSLQSELNNDQISKVTVLSLVVPCFNEIDGLDQLVERLKIVRAAFAGQVDLQVILVDDGSSDGTAEGLEQRFSHLDWASVLRHSSNRGLAAAILTGINSSDSELVASMDADCTYDPMQLLDLWKAMDEETAIVTASPYHPLGMVEGVPGWRLLLSRAASTGYGWLTWTPLHTYTSCFRVYRKSWITGMNIKNEGFVGIAEMLWDVTRRGGKVIEAPARLTSRRIGFSKMKTLPVILTHLQLMTRIALTRCYLIRN